MSTTNTTGGIPLIKDTVGPRGHPPQESPFGTVDLCAVSTSGDGYINDGMGFVLGTRQKVYYDRRRGWMDDAGYAAFRKEVAAEEDRKRKARALERRRDTLAAKKAAKATS